MGYHVAILRTREGRPHPITQEEISTLVQSRKDIRFERGEGGRMDVVTTLPDGSTLRLFWDDAEIWTSDPDDMSLAVMIDLASALGARVRGEEFETYRTVEESYTHPDDRAEVELVQKEIRELVRARKVRTWTVKTALVCAGVGMWLFGYCLSHR